MVMGGQTFVVLLLISVLIQQNLAEVISECSLWDRFDGVHSANGVYQSSGDATIEACLKVCKDDPTCVSIDYNDASTAQYRCYTHLKATELLNKLKDHIKLVRRQGISCPEAFFQELSTCTIYRYSNF